MFRPIEDETALNDALTNYETPTLDFKRTVDPADHLKLARHIAAFANGVGGTILVGVDEARSGNPPRVTGLDAMTAKNIALAFDQAVKDRCSPLPFVTTILIDSHDSKVVAVNVQPLLGIVGVKIPDQKLPSQASWIFPARSGAQTIFLNPEQVGMHTPKMRHAIISLSRIPLKANVSRIRETNRNNGDNDRRNCNFGGISESENVFLVEELNTHKLDMTQIRYPIDLVRSVYMSNEGWEIVIEQFR